MSRQVVITGIGMVTSLGAGPATWRDVLAGRSGIKVVDERPVHPAFRHFGAVDDTLLEPACGDRKALRLLSRPSVLGLLAAGQAIADAGSPPPDAEGDRTAIYVGSAEKDAAFLQTVSPLLLHGRAADGSLDVDLMAEPGLRYLNPSVLLSWLPNSSLCQVTIRHGIRGANACLTEDSPAGLDAVGSAFRAIRGGRADLAVCGGTECLADPVIRNSLLRLGLLSGGADGIGTSAYRPFDQAADGYIPGEGAAFAVIEPRSAVAGDHRVYGEILGFGSATDVRPAPPGDGVRRAIGRALADARLTAGDVDLVIAHGAGIAAGDIAELTGLRQALGCHVDRVPVTAVRQATGYIGAAGDVLQVLVAALVMRHGQIPPILGLTRPVSVGDGIRFVTGRAVQERARCALAVCRASVGGQASALIVRGEDAGAQEAGREL